MATIDTLIRKYPDAPIFETSFHIGQADFDMQVAKNQSRNAEGGTLGVVWVSDHEIALVKRSGMHAGWALPGGTVESGEDFDVAFIREVEEETGVAATLDRLLAIDRRLFIAPAGMQYSFDLAVFEATALPGEQARTTDMAREEDLTVATFAISDLPTDMIFKDRERIEQALALR